MDTLWLFFGLNYFAQGMGGLVFEPLSYLLKDRLHLSAGQSSVFVFWMTLPFLVKPLFGLATDLLPVRGRRRRPYLAAVCALSMIAWLALAGLRSYGYAALLGLMILTNVGLVGSDVVCDAVMVEQGQACGKTGLFQAVQLTALYAALVLSGVGGGWLSAHASMRSVFLISAFFSALVLLSSRWTREPKAQPSAWRAGGRALLDLARGRRFWAVSAFIFLWSFYPFLGTAQFYYQADALKLSPIFIGLTTTLAGAAGALGAAFYGRTVGRRWSTDEWTRAAVWLGAPMSLLYLAYRGPGTVAAVSVVFGFAGVAFRLGLMDLAAQSCPAGAEATAFAAYMAVFDLSAAASNTLGGKAWDWLLLRLPAYDAMALLALVGTAATAACWPLLPAVLGAPGRAGSRQSDLAPAVVT